MPNEGYAMVGKARKELILTVMRGDREYWSVADVNKELKAYHARGEWPQADWPGARQDPYDTGTRQLMEAMVRDEQLERSPHPNSRGLLRVAVAHRLRKRAQEALDLQAKGLNGVQIASELGISKSLAASLLTDPTGAKERERKKGYCPSCGAKKDPASGYCEKCVMDKANALLPEGEMRGAILDEYFRQRAAGCEMLVGVTPDHKRVIRWMTRRGEIELVLDAEQTWENGMILIGLWPGSAVPSAA